MKRITILALVIGSCFASASWAQSPAVRSHMSRHNIHHRAFNLSPKFPENASKPGFTAQAAPACNTEVWDLGTFPGGTWAEMGGVDDFGTAVEQGDTGSDSQTHLFKIQLLGAHGPRWTDMGAMNAMKDGSDGRRSRTLV
jgi:hypothetical protein